MRTGVFGGFGHESTAVMRINRNAATTKRGRRDRAVIRRRVLSGACLLMALLLPSWAAAESALTLGPDEELAVGLGVAVGQSLYKDTGPDWTPFPAVSYESPRFYVRGLGAGWKFVNREALELSAFLAYDPTNFDHSDSDDPRLRALNNRTASLMGGLAGVLNTPVGGLQLSMAGDLLGRSSGWLGSAAYLYSFEPGETDLLEIVPEAGLRWTSANYTNYYYGVSRSEAAKSGLAPYTAGSTFSPYLGLTFDVCPDEHWEFILRGEMSFPGSEIRRSPMVDRNSALELATSVMYNF